MDDKTFLMWLAGYLALPKFDPEVSERLLAMAANTPDGVQAMDKFSDAPSFWKPLPKVAANVGVMTDGDWKELSWQL